MNPCPAGEVTAVRFDELGDHFRRYRLRVPQAVQTMTQSLRRWGQCAPIVATVRQERPQVLDGFTRWEAALQVRGLTTLLVRIIDVDDRRAKAAIHGLNQTGRRPHELEEAWIVQALVREDGLSQTEVAELLARHKSSSCPCPSDRSTPPRSSTGPSTRRGTWSTGRTSIRSPGG